MEMHWQGVVRAGSPAARGCPSARGGTGKRAQKLLPVQSKGELQPLFHNSKLRSQVGVLQGEEGRGSPAGHVCNRAGPQRLLQALTQGQALPRSPCPLSHASRCRLLAQGRGDHVQPALTAKGFSSPHPGQRGIQDQSPGWKPETRQC